MLQLRQDTIRNLFARLGVYIVFLETFSALPPASQPDHVRINLRFDCRSRFCWVKILCHHQYRSSGKS